MAPYLLSSSRRSRLTVSAASVAAALLWHVSPVYAQLDPTLFLKRSQPNIVLAIDTANRMQRDAPTDPLCVAGDVGCTTSVANASSNYYDPFLYTRGTNVTAETTLGVTALNTTSTYRRLYNNLTLQASGNFNTSSISIKRDQESDYSTFDARTRLAIARAALYQAVKQNQNVARFGLIKMRQNNPQSPTQGNAGTVVDALGAQSVNGTTEVAGGKWNISRPLVGGNNGSANANTASIVAADANGASTTVLNKLGIDVQGRWQGAGAAPNPLPSPLLPSGNDDSNTIDTPIKFLLDDVKTAVDSLVQADNSNGNGGQQCRNTVVILVTGGGEGTTGGNLDPSTTAAAFLTNWAGRHVPIYVIAIAPAGADRVQLQNIASKSGGIYFEVTRTQIENAIASNMWSSAITGVPTGTVEVPEVVRAINVAIQAAFENFADLNTATTGNWGATAGVPGTPGDFRPVAPQLIPDSEFQVTTPIIGTVNLTGAKDINGTTLMPDPATVKDRANNVIPQRSNMLLTSAFGLPGFDGKIRAYRVYKPVSDNTQPSGWKFQSDGTALWAACAPGTTTSGPCASLSTNDRNLYTVTPDGTMIAFTVANAPTLAPLMNLTGATALLDATDVINVVRAQPFGTILDSTPAIMNAPSLDPPPNDTYPAFAVANKDRRSIIWVGTNRGVFEALDARLGVEVWGYIPMNMLPKLRTLWDGQAVGSTDFMMDGSPKISDIRLADGTWKTYMFLSQGAGGTFYQTFDVTMAGMGSTVTPTDDTIQHVLTFFASPTVVPLKWSFPLLVDWEPNCANLGANACNTSPYGDLKLTASALEKSVGQTWSDPAIGQVQDQASPYVMLSGSGFLPYSVQQQANRGGIVGGTTFYLFNAETGIVLDSKDVGSDGQYEQQDNCAGVNTLPTPSSDCRQFKNALHSDPVATGPSDSRFITKAYIGDLDGRLWRFNIQLDGSNVPQFTPGAGNPTKLYDDALKQPIFASMATVNVGGTQQYIFTGTGADLLPANAVSEQYRLLGILDNGATGTKTFEIDLNKVDGNNGDEKVTTFPAVAGDIVFFTTTTFNPASPCVLPTASLYALTFIGGPAYDTNNDGKFTNQDSTLVQSVAGVRGTAPFIVDQHLVFGTGGKVQIFGDSADYNNGIGQAGVRILSWREVR